MWNPQTALFWCYSHETGGFICAKKRRQFDNKWARHFPANVGRRLTRRPQLTAGLRDVLRTAGTQQQPAQNSVYTGSLKG